MTDTATEDAATTEEAPNLDDIAAEDTATEEDAAETGDDQPDDAETFPRSVVEKLRQENGRYRQRAQQTDAYAQRLHTELVRATGRLADPSDLEFDAEHLDDAEALTAAIDELLTDKPHLASRKPVGDIGQGHRGGSSEPFSLLGMLKERT
ncbi:hypothetical protein H7J93_23715 [Mycobacterium barrassiae]|uniref:hypothetical protein n=1 Tax=Mycobacterium barrassiae TaxID=319709 RepID=UPI002265864B|nr:hypothetical protein [Mycobacterium barrassiae]MCV7302636.1 hypothetical protein [Mycobacterium barrassiae]